MEQTDDQVVLVDAMGRPTGRMDKLAAHRSPGHWHAAFSVMLRDAHGRMLLHRRAAGKYHFPGRWTNSCCSHLRWGESLQDAVTRRLDQELGLDMEPLVARLAGSFWYRAVDPASGLVEQEHDQVVVVDAVGHDVITPNVDEMDDVRWADGATIDDLVATPSASPWLGRVVDLVRARPDD